MQPTKTKKQQSSKVVPYRINIDAEGENSQHSKIKKAKKDLGLTRETDVIRVALAFYFNKNGY